MTTSVSRDDIYSLAPHYRFQWEEAQQCYVLLFPEGMVKLNGGAGEVIKRVDGNKTVDAVVQELEAAFPGVPDLAADEEHWIDRCAIAHVAYNTLDRCEVLCKRPTPIFHDGQEVARVFHYSDYREMPATHTLFAPSLSWRPGERTEVALRLKWQRDRAGGDSSPGDD